MPRHTIRQGDTVMSLSTRYGVPVDKIWDHPDNQTLREGNRKPGILSPGDVITIPEIEPKTVDAETEQRHRIRCQSKTTWLKVRFLKNLQNDEPFANEPYVLRVAGDFQEGSLDSDGRLEVRVPADAEEALVILGAEQENGQFRLRLGHLDPIDEPSGVRQRLNNLGLYCAQEDGELGPKAQAALRQFQKINDMDTTGDLDDSTKESLKGSHGA